MMTTYLLDLVILLAAAVVMVPLFQAARLGAVPGFLVAGVLVGPSVLGWIDRVEEIAHLAEIGVVLLLFVIGLELKPSRLWLMRRLVFGLGSAQVLLTGAAITAVAYFGFALPASSAVLVGLALGLSSTAFVIQILAQQRALHATYGRTSFSILLMQDLAVVPLLALVPLLAQRELGVGANVGLALLESLAILGAVVIGGRYLLHPLLHRVARAGSPEVFTATAVLIVIGVALVTEHAGLSMAMGAFLAGLLISESSFRHQVIAEIEPFRGLLLGIFFTSMGMLLDVDRLLEAPLVALGLLLGLLGLKAALLFPMARIAGLTSRQAAAVALLLAQAGEFALVIFALARKSDLLAPDVFQQLLLVVLLSMLVTPALAHFAQRLGRAPESGAPEDTPPEDAGVPVVLAGYGRVGRRIGDLLTRAAMPFIALESNASIVARERARGHPVYFGDASKSGVLRSVGAGAARIIIVTLNDPEAAEQLVAGLRDQYPDASIFARGHNLEACRRLRRLGATGVVSENLEASLEISRMVLAASGADEEHSEAILADFRDRYHALIHDPDAATDAPAGKEPEPDASRDGDDAGRDRSSS